MDAATFQLNGLYANVFLENVRQVLVQVHMWNTLLKEQYLLNVQDILQLLYVQNQEKLQQNTVLKLKLFQA